MNDNSAQQQPSLEGGPIRYSSLPEIYGMEMSSSAGESVLSFDHDLGNAMQDFSQEPYTEGLEQFDASLGQMDLQSNGYETNNNRITFTGAGRRLRSQKPPTPSMSMPAKPTSSKRNGHQKTFSTTSNAASSKEQTRLDKRRERNREAAKRSRDRRLSYISQLEQRITWLMQSNRELRLKVDQLTAELEGYRNAGSSGGGGYSAFM